MIYLDYASSTPVDPNVLETFIQTETAFIGNPTSNHQAGKDALHKMNQITSSISNLFNCDPSNIIYTSGASESNNLALKGMAKSYRHYGKHILSTYLEHPSVSGSLTALQEEGYEIELINILEDGTVDLEHFKELLRNDTIIVSIVYVDSELGAIQPINKISDILKEYPNCHFHVDATQAIGKIPLTISGIDSLSLSSHKFYGICGSGLLIKNNSVILEPLIHGGVSTTIYRSGTPALSLIASMEKALTIAFNKQVERSKYVTEVREYLISQLTNYPNVVINSPKNSSPYIINISVKYIKATLFQQALDHHGVCVSIKSACSINNTPSRPVFAVSKDKKNALSSWRISLSHLTTKEEIDNFLEVFNICYKELIK